MTEWDRGIRAHKIAPSMRRQLELNVESFQGPADRPVLYKMSNCANRPEDVCLLMRSESSSSGSKPSMYKHAVNAHMNRPSAASARDLILSSPG